MVAPIEHLLGYIFDNIVIPFEAAKVNCVAVWVCARSAKRVDTAILAKPVAGLICSELI